MHQEGPQPTSPDIYEERHAALIQGDRWIVDASGGKAQFAAAAYNLVRLPKLIAETG